MADRATLDFETKVAAQTRLVLVQQGGDRGPGRGVFETTPGSANLAEAPSYQRVCEFFGMLPNTLVDPTEGTVYGQGSTTTENRLVTFISRGK